LLYTKPKQPKKIYYQQLNIPINELENKKQFKVVSSIGLSVKTLYDFCVISVHLGEPQAEGGEGVDLVSVQEGQSIRPASRGQERSGADREWHRSTALV